MWMLSSTPSAARLRRPNGLILAVAGLLATAAPAAAQQIVFDPRNHLENALQAARQLESLANEARSLAASPYSHMTASSQSLRDMAELARSVRGLATSVSGLERQFETFYPTDLTGADALRILEQSGARTANARRTAEDLARTAAELERLSQKHDKRHPYRRAEPRRRRCVFPASFPGIDPRRAGRSFRGLFGTRARGASWAVRPMSLTSGCVLGRGMNGVIARNPALQLEDIET